MNLVVAEAVSIQETPAIEAVEELKPSTIVEKEQPKPKSELSKPASAAPNQSTPATKVATTAAVESTDEEVKEILQIAETSNKEQSGAGQTEVIMSKSFTESVKPRLEFKPVPEEFYNTLFYFSGMGNVIGTALAEGVYVPEHTAKRAPSAEAVEEIMKNQKIPNKGEEIVKSARTQAIDVTLELKHLQSLLGALPIYSDGVNKDGGAPQHHTPREPPKVERAILAHTQITDELDRKHTQVPKRPVHTEAHVVPTNNRTAQSAPFVPTAMKSAHVLPPQPQYVPKVPTINAPAPIAPKLPNFLPPGPKPSPPAPKFNPPAPPPVVNPPAPKFNPPVPPPVANPPAPKPYSGSSGVYSQPPMPAQHPLAAELSKNRTTGARPYGVHTAQPELPTSTTPWQQRYGNKGVPQKKNPADFAVDHHQKAIDGTGMKSWQKSHLRAVEARGKYTYVDGPSYDQNIADQNIADDIESLAPFLTSRKTFTADRGSQHQNVHPGSAFHPVNPVAVNGDLPYCDL